MSRDNRIADRLARGVRAARKTAPAESPPTAAKPAAAKPAAAKPAGGRAAKTKAPATEQSPASTLDWPWDHLHPARIWPD